jgi:hypothetical protein
VLSIAQSDIIVEVGVAMTDRQLYLSIGVPILFNAAMFGILIAYINAKIDGVNSRVDAVHTRIDALRAEMNARFEAQSQALLRVEQSWMPA